MDNVLAPVKTLPLGTSNCRKIWLSPTGDHLAYTYMNDRRVDEFAIVDLNSEQRIHTSAVGGSGWLFDLAWSPDEHYLLLGKKEHLEIWDGRGRTLLSTKPDPECYTIAFSPSGRRLALGFGGKQTRLYNTADYLELPTH